MQTFFIKPFLKLLCTWPSTSCLEEYYLIGWSEKYSHYNLWFTEGRVLFSVMNCDVWYADICCIQSTLRWRHDERDGVSNHQPQDYLLNRLFRHTWEITSKLRVTGLCEGNSPVTGKFPTQRASNAKSASIWWRHHEKLCDKLCDKRPNLSFRTINPSSFQTANWLNTIAYSVQRDSWVMIVFSRLIRPRDLLQWVYCKMQAFAFQHNIPISVTQYGGKAWISSSQSAVGLIKSTTDLQWPLLLTWFNFNPSMDK